jgi:hypothetical protein
MSIQDNCISETTKTPGIMLNPEGVIKIRGRWMMENIADFSRKLSSWFDTYACDPPEISCIDINLEYFNGFNSGLLISLLRKVLFINRTNKWLIVNWYYDEGDEDILELGEYLSLILEKPFNFIMVTDSKNSRDYIQVSA